MYYSYRGRNTFITLARHRAKNNWIASYDIFYRNLIPPFILLTQKLGYPTFENRRMMNTIAYTLQKEIDWIRQTGKFQNNAFFQIRVYDRGYPFPLYDAAYWRLLENVFQEKFVQTNSTRGAGYVTLNEDSYIFIVCQHYDYADNECKKAFLNQHPHYMLMKDVYTKYPILIYLAKKEHTTTQKIIGHSS